MRRIASWLAFVIAATILVIAILELDSRTNDDGLVVPSPPATSAATTG